MFITQYKIIDNLYFDEFEYSTMMKAKQISRISGNYICEDFKQHIQLMQKILNKEFYRDWK